MAERKAVNKYYPPDWTPDKGSINKYVGQHPLRERAKKLSQGILVIRFELPYNIWCGGCGSHVGMGVRYNAEKKKVGSYYSTPIYRFRMKCHLCDNYFEIETDPKNCDYTVVSGARRKNEQWEPSATETVETTDKEDAKRMAIDAMFKLEHGVEDVQKSKKVAPVLHQLKEVQSIWKDDYAANKLLRKKFREEKKNIADVKKADDELRKKGSLDIALVPENPEDIERAKKIRFYNTGFDAHKRSKRREIEEKSWFSEASTNPLASKLPSLISHRKRKSTASDEKDEWKNSVVVKTSSTNGKSDTSSCETEEKRPYLNTSGEDPEKTEKQDQIRDCPVNHTTSIDEDVLVTSTSRSEFLPDSLPSKFGSAINSNHGWSKEEDTFRTCAEWPLSTLSEESLSNEECLSSGLVSSLYSSGSSDDDSELQ